MAKVNSYTGVVPTPDKTSLAAITEAANEILEEEGLSSLTMAAVAAKVGVKAPSLYKRVRNRDELLRLVLEKNLDELSSRFTKAADLKQMANEFRAFAHARPIVFQLVMTSPSKRPIASAEALRDASQTLIKQTETLVGAEKALAAARTLTAWATGFISMELSGGFNLGGNVEDAWDFGISTLTTALMQLKN